MSSTSFSALYTSELACTQSACSLPEPELIGTLVRLSQPSHTWLLMYHSHTTSPLTLISRIDSTYMPSAVTLPTCGQRPNRHAVREGAQGE